MTHFRACVWIGSSALSWGLTQVSDQNGPFNTGLDGKERLEVGVIQGDTRELSNQEGQYLDNEGTLCSSLHLDPRRRILLVWENRGGKTGSGEGEGESSGGIGVKDLSGDAVNDGEKRTGVLREGEEGTGEEIGE
ncbi:hypothetical protein EAG_14213 [Camponotus floridanus]|uniref:Uncharacterized protein n=1 Tax=Camponotus floridanus TaxID=104421 RepID=E2B1Z1_CAMFO|nr:hypothetical protein EAG_14213 [Camponotus floridanus]